MLFIQENSFINIYTEYIRGTGKKSIICMSGLKGKMSKPRATELHIRHCMLFYFDQGWNATQATEALSNTYGSELTVDRCQFWFRRFASGDRSLKDEPKSGRPSKFDDDSLKAMMESDPH